MKTIPGYIAGLIQVAIIIAILVFTLRGCNKDPIIYPKPKPIIKTVIEYDTIIQSRIIEKKIPVMVYQKPGKHFLDSVVFMSNDSSGLFMGIIKDDTARIRFSIIDTSIHLRQVDTVSQVIIRDPGFQLSAGMIAIQHPIPVIQARIRSCSILAGYDFQGSRPMFGLLIPIRIFGSSKRSKANREGNTQGIDPAWEQAGSVIYGNDERYPIKDL